MVREPNIVPFLDVLLVLLVIFMLLANLGWIRLQLPPPVPTGPARGSEAIVLELTPQGGFAVNGTAVPADSLLGFLVRTFADRPEKAIFLATARERSWNDVIAAADVAREAGVEVVGMIERPRQ